MYVIYIILKIKEGEGEAGGGKRLTEDERNKIGAKILKAEMKGDKVRKIIMHH